MKSLSYLIIVTTLLTFLTCTNQNKTTNVLVGLDRLEEFEDIFKDKNIGIITNHTAYDKNNIHISNIFFNKKDVNVVALFGPEHGIKGDADAGGKIDDSYDAKNEIPVYSLYGKNKKPTPEMIKSCDMLVFDIQDVGARFYTYISTMALAMEAAAENNIDFVVLDRPNPIKGIDVEGNILDLNFSSFVGMFPIPVRHGMTIGELAKMINEEGWLRNGKKVNLKIIPMSGWKRYMWYDDTNLTWRPPSPNIPDLQVAAVYPGVCLFEGTNISEGRGTYQPFLKIGAPWYNVENFSNINNILELNGLKMVPISFTPKSIPGMSVSPKFLDKEVRGLMLSVKDRNKFRPYISAIALIKYFYEQQAGDFKWRESHFDRLCGTDQIRKFIIDGYAVADIEEWYNNDLEGFRKKRQKYLLY